MPQYSHLASSGFIPHVALILDATVMMFSLWGFHVRDWSSMTPRYGIVSVNSSGLLSMRILGVFKNFFVEDYYLCFLTIEFELAPCAPFNKLVYCGLKEGDRPVNTGSSPQYN